MTSPGDPAVLPSSRAPFRIGERLPSHPDAARLLQAFHDEQVDRYGFADPAELSAAEYAPPNGVFAMAYQGAAAGCGGYRWFDRATGTVEIKRIYVIPASRGHGIGRALLAWLENHAVQVGAQRGILETGVRNTAALNLFTSAGYPRWPAMSRAATQRSTAPSPGLSSAPLTDLEGQRPGDLGRCGFEMSPGATAIGTEPLGPPGSRAARAEAISPCGRLGRG